MHFQLAQTSSWRGSTWLRSQTGLQSVHIISLNILHLNPFFNLIFIINPRKQLSHFNYQTVSAIKFNQM